MKTLSLIVSLVVMAIAGYFFVKDFRFVTEINHLIYMSLLVVLMMICVVGILINVPLIVRERRKMKMFVYNKFSKRAIRAKGLKLNYETS